MRSPALLYRKIYLLVLAIFLTFPFEVLSECPPCFFEQIPVDGPAAADGSGRRTYYVKIDSSWGNPTNATIWNQTGNALVSWNFATDQSGNKTGYFLNHSQVASPHILIKKDQYQAANVPASLWAVSRTLLHCPKAY